MQVCKPRSMPCEIDSNLMDESNAEPVYRKYYREIVGSLIYVMTAAVINNMNINKI